MRSYRIFFVAGTEDHIQRDRPIRSAEELAAARAIVEQKRGRFDNWLTTRKLALENYSAEKQKMAAKVEPVIAPASLPVAAVVVPQADVVKAAEAISAALLVAAPSNGL